MTRIRNFGLVFAGILIGGTAVFVLAYPSGMKNVAAQEVAKISPGSKYQVSGWGTGSDHGIYILDNTNGDIFSVSRSNSPIYLGKATTAVEKPIEPASAKESKSLVGTWKLTFARYNGQDFEFGNGITVIKQMTPDHFMTVIYDQNGRIQRASGGTYVVEGDVYKETPEFGTSENFAAMKNITQTFGAKLDGNTWRYSGKLSIGMEMEEVYARVTKD